MEILKKTYPLILATILAGCSDEVVLDINPEPVLCINSMFTAGEPVEVDVTRSWLYTDEASADDHTVRDAKVSIYANGEPVDAGYLPHEGDTLRIVAESAAYGSAEAEVVVPVSVPIAALKWDAEVTSITETPNYDYMKQVYHIDLQARLTINDPSASADYYQFTYMAFPYGFENDGHPIDRFRPGTFYAEVEPIFSEHIGGIDAVDTNPDGFTFFTDRQFAGRTYTLNLLFKDMTLTLDKKEITDDLLDCGLVMNLNSVSPSYYRWNLYTWNVRNGSMADLGEFGFADPVWGYSNVSTGAGVVAARSCCSDTIRLKDFLMQHSF